jgi:hypothetical protein
VSTSVDLGCEEARVIALGWHLVLAAIFFGFGMPFTLNLCHFFSRGNSGWYTYSLFTEQNFKIKEKSNLGFPELIFFQG